MSKLKLSIHKMYRKCIDTDGYWDGTWDESYEYIIYNEEGYEVTGMGGYLSEEAARKAGEERLKRREEIVLMVWKFRQQEREMDIERRNKEYSKL